MRNFTKLTSLLVLLLILLMTCPGAEAQGWRNDEMEVRVTLHSRQDAAELAGLHLNGDIYTDYALMYVTPAELEQIRGTGLQYKVTKEDLNTYYRDFWETRDDYHTYEEIVYIMDSLAEAMPGLVMKKVYGESLGGRELSALKISDNVTVDENEAEVAFDGNIHGDEITGGENAIRFARWLCQQYDQNATITNLINNREIWIYPLVNPDGRANMTRYNNNGVDLNRDWGYIWNGEGSSFGPYSQPESKALRQMVLDNQFSIHMTFHSGIELFLYPWYFYEVPSPDNDQVEELAYIYASTSGYDDLETGPGTSLYPTTGSTAEAYYGVKGSLGIVMELAYNKQPPASQIGYYFDINLQPCIHLIEYAGYGVEGTVTDAETGDPVSAVVYVGNTLPCYADPEVGDFHKFMMPGTYTLTVMANGYQTKVVSNVNVEELTSTVVDVQLDPEVQQSIYQVCASQRPDAYSEYEQPSWKIIGPPDNISYSLGRNGWIVFDMETLVLDGSGSDLIVFEGDATAEGYELFAGTSIDGPWSLVGEGTGTTEFDLANSSLSEARYFKIQDDGDGNNNADAGFELDAAQSISSIAGPYILMEELVVDDSQGNNNGQVDPGETADLIVTLKNIGTEDALNVLGEMLTGDEYIDILTAEPQDYGNMPTGQSATATFTITADEQVPAGHTAALELSYTGDNGLSGSKYIELLFPDYCMPTANCSYGDGFSGFALEQINNMNNGCSTGGYGNFTDMSATLTAGETYTVQWTSDYGDQNASLWIDLNSDKEFSAEEMLIADFNLVNSGQVYSTDFTLPETTLPGEYRLRIRANWLDSSADPCAIFSYGETEDYTVVVEGGNAIIPAFTADLTEFCAGGQVQFTDQSQGTITDWNWAFPGGDPETSSAQNPLVTYAQPGTFDVSLTASNGSNTETITYEGFIEVHALPEVQFDAIGDMCINWPAYQLTEGSPAGGTYSGPGVDNGWFTPEVAGLGTHTITYTYTDEFGCMDMAEQNVYVDACTGIGETAAKSLVRPNPSDGNFEISFAVPLQNAHIRIVNAMGQIVDEMKDVDAAKGSAVSVHLADAGPGLYLLIVDGSGLQPVRIMIE